MGSNDFDWLIIVILVILFCILEILVALRWDPVL